MCYVRSDITNETTSPFINVIDQVNDAILQLPVQLVDLMLSYLFPTIHIPTSSPIGIPVCIVCSIAS
jgi:hypothetical protein